MDDFDDGGHQHGQGGFATNPDEIPLDDADDDGVSFKSVNIASTANNNAKPASNPDEINLDDM
jgi:hypothetical protein